MPLVLYHRVNEYVTGICTLILASERFIVYCKPDKVDTYLTRTKRKVIYSVATVVIIALTIFEISYRFKTFHHWQYFNCSYGFLEGEIQSFYSMIATGIIFFAVPAVISIVMYICIFVVLFRAQSRRVLIMTSS